MVDLLPNTSSEGCWKQVLFLRLDGISRECGNLDTINMYALEHLMKTYRTRLTRVESL